MPNTDRLNTKCTRCKKGYYIETSFYDDIDGKLHCSNCGNEIQRHKIIKITEGAQSKGGQNPPNTTSKKPPSPRGSGTKKHPKLDILLLDDWSAVYFDGIMVLSGHTVRWDELLSLLKIDYQTHYLSNKELKEKGEDTDYGWQPPDSFKNLEHLL